MNRQGLPSSRCPSSAPMSSIEPTRAATEISEQTRTKPTLVIAYYHAHRDGQWQATCISLHQKKFHWLCGRSMIAAERQITERERKQNGTRFPAKDTCAKIYQTFESNRWTSLLNPDTRTSPVTAHTLINPFLCHSYSLRNSRTYPCRAKERGSISWLETEIECQKIVTTS